MPLQPRGRDIHLGCQSKVRELACGVIEAGRVDALGRGRAEPFDHVADVVVLPVRGRSASISDRTGKEDGAGAGAAFGTEQNRATSMPTHLRIRALPRCIRAEVDCVFHHSGRQTYCGPVGYWLARAEGIMIEGTQTRGGRLPRLKARRRWVCPVSSASDSRFEWLGLSRWK